VQDPEDPEAFFVLGRRPERWNRLGVEDALARAGAVPGNSITIGDVTFDWEPSTPAGIAVRMSGRGTDMRLEDHSRPRAVERKESRRIRRDGPDEIEGGMVESSAPVERDS
jgi:GTP-binding protein